MATEVETPEKKQSFDWIYVQPDPVAYKTEILDKRTYICDNNTRREFDRLIQPNIDALLAQRASSDGKVHVTDLGCCFGNTSLALLNGMSTDEIRKNWKDADACKTIAKPRRFPAVAIGIDISEPATAYCRQAGIMDEVIAANLNTDEGLKKAQMAIKGSDILICTAALVYLNVESVDFLIREFAAGAGEGFVIVNFLNPFELEKSDKMKRILLKHLDFVGSTAARHRTMSEKEESNYPDHGDWALLEIWVLQRKTHLNGNVKVVGLTAEEDLRAQAYYDSDDAFEFYKQIWGGDNLHVGIYDDSAMELPLGPERVKIASERSLERLLQKMPPKADDRVIDMGSAYGGCARYIATKFKASVSCVDLSAKENERNRVMTKASGLDNLVLCPGERSFTETGEPSASFDLVVSQDSFLHAGQHREKSIAESARVLKPGGHLVFSDIMQSDNCDFEQMAPVYKRINLDDMGSPNKYIQWAEKAGLEFLEFENLTENLAKHYRTVRGVLLDKQQKGELAGKLSDAFIEKMAAGLQSWVDQAGNNNLTWGFMVFTKPMGESVRGSTLPKLPSILPKSPSYSELHLAGMPAVSEALIVAASRLSDLDSLSGPKCLIRLGNLPIICHVLAQMHHAGVKRAVVLCGYKGEKIKEAVEQFLDRDCKDAFQIDFVMAGEDWRQGSAHAVLRAQSSFQPADKFLVCMADHIFDPSAVATMCSVCFVRDEQAFCLLETDTKGMVGMAPSCVKVQLASGSQTKVSTIGRSIELGEASGVDAGLFTCNYTLFEKLKTLSNQCAYFSLADALQMYANDGALLAVKTEGKMWFGVETREALEFAVADGLKQIGTITEDENWLGDGAFDQDGNRIPIVISGHGKEVKSAGAKWSEFTVERWRSAVYINLSYFGELCTDTINFIVEIAKHIKLMGQRTSLIEVGCGTGEFIRPIADHFRLAIGMDFNENFINFCHENIPKGKEAKQDYYVGDACELVDLMQKKAPKHIWEDTKIVACVGNTIGIIPESMKDRVYQQMAELAGPDGVVVIVYWNARCFGDACQNFYHANPQLCGPFAGDSIDFNTTTLQTPDPWNYRTHWTGIEEARAMLRKHSLEEIMVEEKGKGVLVAARKNTKSQSFRPVSTPDGICANIKSSVTLF